uniref:Uncharacterized protein n=1 Tax=Romanomermis culicivorax TaxID=13658 RepID=A0A915IF15_ROMCU
QSTELLIDDIDATILSSFLRFVDDGIISDLDKESIIDGRTDHLSGLLYAGHKYMVDDLVQTCTSFMQFWMSDRNVEHFLNLSNIYDIPNLKNCALDFMQCRK